MMQKGDYLSIRQALDVIPITRPFLYRLNKKHDGRIMRKVGGKVLVDMTELEEIIRGGNGNEDRV